jgi:hypothetical protein
MDGEPDPASRRRFRGAIVTPGHTANALQYAARTARYGYSIFLTPDNMQLLSPCPASQSQRHQRTSAWRGAENRWASPMSP